jgi:hypothetical protein
VICALAGGKVSAFMKVLLSEAEKGAVINKMMWRTRRPFPCGLLFHVGIGNRWRMNKTFREMTRRHLAGPGRLTVAFPGMSRPIRTRALSALRLASYKCSGFSGLSQAPLCGPLPCKSTQFSRVCLGVLSILDSTAYSLYFSVYSARRFNSLICLS